MGWWRTGQGDDMLGDGPVDRLEDALRIFTAGGAKLKLERFLGAAAAALRSNADLILDDPSEVEGRRLIVRWKSPAPEVESSDESEEIELRDHLAVAFIEIADEYEGCVGRKPHLGELLGTTAFCLGVRPERFFEIEEGRSVAEVAAR